VADENPGQQISHAPIQPPDGLIGAPAG
jgi:hypothetical protein